MWLGWIVDVGCVSLIFHRPKDYNTKLIQVTEILHNSGFTNNETRRPTSQNAIE
jgi:hypothetical protein